ncbi:MAG: pilus assembly protein TadG-related protein [Desulfofundulus sp.]
MMKKLYDVCWKLGREVEGTVLVLVAAMMTVILGVAALATDVGVLALERNRLQNACDAAALAAARELPSTGAAREKAEEYLEYNGVKPEDAVISFDSSGTKVTVEASRQVNFTFARVFGLSGGQVSARASAIFGSVKSMTGVVPFGIPDQQLVYGQEYKLKAGSQDEYGPGNYGALALEFRGASNYENNLKYGYSGTISVGDWVLTEPGNMSGPTEEGVNYRLSLCPHIPKCTIDSYHPDCPRIMIVPIFDPTDLSGRDEVRIVGFGAFLLKGVEGAGKESIVTGYFLQMVPPQGLRYTLDPNGADYGLHAAKLVE